MAISEKNGQVPHSWTALCATPLKITSLLVFFASHETDPTLIHDFREGHMQFKSISRLRGPVPCTVKKREETPELLTNAE